VKENIILVIKSTRICWAGHEACIEDRRGTVHIGLQWGDFMKKDHLEDPDIDGMIILKCIF